MFAWHDTPWMWLSMIVFWSLFVYVFYYVFKSRRSSAAEQSSPRATEILEERFARGDISADEYRESRETLQTTGAPRGDG